MSILQYTGCLVISGLTISSQAMLSFYLVASTDGSPRLQSDP